MYPWIAPTPWSKASRKRRRDGGLAIEKRERRDAGFGLEQERRCGGFEMEEERSGAGLGSYFLLFRVFWVKV